MNRGHAIIVVDDDLEDQFILKEYFDDIKPGASVKYLDNGKIAMDYLLDCSPADLPCLIVLDLNMPIMNGTQTLLQIKRTMALKNIPVIILSTSDNEEEKRKCLSFGAIDYVTKPASWGEGVEIVKRFTSFIPADGTSC